MQEQPIHLPKIPRLHDLENWQIVYLHYLRAILESLNCDIEGTLASNLGSHGGGHHDRFGDELKKVH